MCTWFPFYFILCSALFCCSTVWLASGSTKKFLVFLNLVFTKLSRTVDSSRLFTLLNAGESDSSMWVISTPYELTKDSCSSLTSKSTVSSYLRVYILSCVGINYLISMPKGVLSNLSRNLWQFISLFKHSFLILSISSFGGGASLSWTILWFIRLNNRL